jgi:hypothetical protein
MYFSVNKGIHSHRDLNSESSSTDKTNLLGPMTSRLHSPTPRVHKPVEHVELSHGGGTVWWHVQSVRTLYVQLCNEFTTHYTYSLVLNLVPGIVCGTKRDYTCSCDVNSLHNCKFSEVSVSDLDQRRPHYFRSQWLDVITHAWPRIWVMQQWPNLVTFFSSDMKWYVRRFFILFCFPCPMYFYYNW